ncbi:hypothetical protein TURU_144647 [Turdus rufiventris]|nr:hypothetical protein TURU_144647 [Turdus rufiventris]
MKSKDHKLRSEDVQVYVTYVPNIPLVCDSGHEDTAGSLLPDCLLPTSIELDPSWPITLPLAFLSGFQGKSNIFLHPEVSSDPDCSSQGKVVG